MSLYSITPDEALPFSIAIYFKGRHLIFRETGMMFEGSYYNKFVYRRIHRIFVPEDQYSAYLNYVKKKNDELMGEGDKSLPENARAAKRMINNVKQVSTKLFSFESDQEIEENLLSAVRVSTEVVENVLNRPYMNVYDLLPMKSSNVIDHSLRVSVMATYLGWQLGFVNPTALEQLAAAGLLHDIGKTRLLLGDEFSLDVLGEEKNLERESQEQELLKHHPRISCDMLGSMNLVPQEVFRIIREHHEARDRSGYPNAIGGSKMYGLSRVFAIANTFDNLSSEIAGDRKTKYLGAAKIMVSELRGKFDTTLLPKAIKFLTYGL